MKTLQSDSVSYKRTAVGNMRLFKTITLAVATLLSTACLTGCDNGSNYPHATISGVVTLEGAPIQNGTITYFPTDQIDSGSGGFTTINNGEYHLDNVPIGKVAFTFSASIETGNVVEIFGEQVPEKINPVPAKYQNQGLQRDITESGEQDFALQK